MAHSSNGFAVIALAAAIALPPLAAHAFTASNKFVVVPASGDQFEVFATGGGGGPDFFCAAGEYADRMTRAGPTDRVMLVQDVGRSQRNNGTRSGIFKIVPRGTASHSGISVSMKAGENLSIAHATALCDNLRFQRSD